MFRRTVGEQVLDFGISGVLRFSNLIIFDRQTESWWQQIGGEAIVGELTGTKMDLIPSPIVSWAEFKTTNPDGKILDRETGFSKPYGRNPYVGYDSGSPFLFRGPQDDRLPAIERVATVELEDETVAFPFSVLEKEPVVHQTIAGQELVVFFKKGTASALDNVALAEGRAELAGLSIWGAFEAHIFPSHVNHRKRPASEGLGTAA